jgi:hypothetical protein
LNVPDKTPKNVDLDSNLATAQKLFRAEDSNRKFRAGIAALYVARIRLVGEAAVWSWQHEVRGFRPGRTWDQGG